MRPSVAPVEMAIVEVGIRRRLRSWLKGAESCGRFEALGILRCAQDDDVKQIKPIAEAIMALISDIQRQDTDR
jgi:hypothetical protein